MCRQISDAEVLLYTKQYFTISAIVNILVEMENGNLPVLNITEHAIDITKIIPYPPPNLEIYMAVYKPTKEIRGLDRPEEVFMTYLHKYNEFVMQNEQLNANDRKTKASEIRTNLVSNMKELLKYITAFCGDVGIPKSQE